MAQDQDKPAVTVTAVGLTDVGRVREHNEDSILVVDPASGRHLGNGEKLECTLETAMLMAVADGMGGAAAGEVASNMAVTRFSQTLRDADLDGASPDQIDALIDQALQQANTDIKQDGEENPERKGMGTTFTAVVFVAGKMFVAQVGDSRGYLLRKGTFVRLTRDQSLREQLIEEGTLTPEEAEQFGGGNIILQALGVEERVRPDTKSHDVLRGDLLLLCSDGLSGMITDDEMEAIVKEHEDDLETAVQKLIDAANANGGRDNISVVLGRFGGEGLRAPLEGVSAADIETAGGVFKPPPPPEVPNPMKKVGAALGVVLLLLVLGFFVFARTTATIKVAVTAAGDLDGSVPVRVILLDADGNAVQEQDAVSGRAEFRDVDPGDYQLRAEAPNYWEQDVALPVADPADISPEPINLRPKAGTLLVRSRTPFVSIAVVPVGSGHPDEIVDNDALIRQFKQELTTPLKFTIPPGDYEVIATRPGFAEQRIQGRLDPQGEATAEVELQEVKGKLTIVCAVAGVEVSLKDGRSHEALLDAPVVTTGEPITVDVRVGEHTAEGRLAGYRVPVVKVEVPVEGTGTVELVPAASEVATVLSHNVRGRVIVRRKADNEKVAGTVMNAAEGRFKTRVLTFPPGIYVVEIQIAGKSTFKEFEVAVGAADFEVELDK